MNMLSVFGLVTTSLECTPNPPYHPVHPSLLLLNSATKRGATREIPPNINFILIQLIRKMRNFAQ